MEERDGILEMILGDRAEEEKARATYRRLVAAKEKENAGEDENCETCGVQFRLHDPADYIGTQCVRQVDPRHPRLGE